MSPLAAQAGRVTGRLLRATATDTAPIAGRVVLHRLSAQAQGPIDTIPVGPDGRFRLAVATDTASLYLVSARHAGIEYFSRPVRNAPGAPDTLTLLVHDTSSSAPVRLAERYLLVSRATTEGQATPRRSVLDLLIIRNPSTLTRAAADSTAPTWTFPMPKDAGDLLAGEGEFSAAAFEQRGDSLLYLAPVLPGERQLVVRYSVPAAGPLDFPTTRDADSVIVLLEEASARVAGDAFARGDSAVIDGRTYFRWAGGRGVDNVRLEFDGANTGRDPLPFLVAALGLLLAGGVAIALRRRRPPPAAPVAPPAADEVTRLVDAIARLDAEYGGREAELDEATRTRYAAERAQLRAQLDRALASKASGR